MVEKDTFKLEVYLNNQIKKRVDKISRYRVKMVNLEYEVNILKEIKKGVIKND